MKPILMIIAAILFVAPAVLAQDLVEYARQPLIPPKLSRATSALTPHDGDAKPPGKVTEVAAQEKKTPEKTESAPKPNPMAIFILTNGTRIESGNYIVTAESLQVEEKGTWRTIPLSALNAKETVADNKARGIDMMIPSSPNQITLSF